MSFQLIILHQLNTNCPNTEKCHGILSQINSKTNNLNCKHIIEKIVSWLGIRFTDTLIWIIINVVKVMKFGLDNHLPVHFNISVHFNWVNFPAFFVHCATNLCLHKHKNVKSQTMFCNSVYILIRLVALMFCWICQTFTSNIHDKTIWYVVNALQLRKGLHNFSIRPNRIWIYIIESNQS